MPQAHTSLVPRVLANTDIEFAKWPPKYFTLNTDH